MYTYPTLHFQSVIDISVTCHMSAPSVTCGGKITSPGTIQSPNYPSNYPSSKICEWVIEFLEGETIELDFVELDLEYNSACRYDWVEIRDGDKSNSSLIGNKLCGNQTPQPIRSNGNQLYVQFRSDGSVTKKGFNIEVKRIN